MHAHNLEGLLAILALFVLPSAAICSRIIVGSIVRLRGARPLPPPPEVARMEGRLEALEDEMRQMSDRLDRVVTAVEFDAQLRGGASATAPSAQLPPA